MRKMAGLLGLPLLVLISGCAAGNAALLKSLIGKNVTISIAPDVSLPEKMIFDVPAVNNTAANPLARLVQDTARQNLVPAFQQAMQAAAKPLGGQLTRGLRARLKAQQIFGDVTEQGGQAQLKLSVSQFGVRAPQGISSIRPVLTVKAELIVPQIGSIWQAEESVDELTQEIKSLDLKDFALNRKIFSDPYGAAVDLITQRLAKKLGGL
jgi:hypothetical protein